MIYLDWAATALPDDDILDEIRKAEKEYAGNPSSIHREGRKARLLLTGARETIAACLRIAPLEVVFTSGGTESNNMLLFSFLSRNPLKSSFKRKIITTGIEHPSVYEPASVLSRMGYEIVFLPPGPDGRIRIDDIAAQLDQHTVCVSLQYVNNETGAVQPIGEAGRLIREYERKNGQRIIFHADAVQALGKVRFYPDELLLDAASISAHKLGGPKGSGCLYLKKTAVIEFLYKGGDQEEKRRPGTENTAAAYGLALAVEKSLKEQENEYARTQMLMEKLITGLAKIDGVVFIPEVRKESALRKEPVLCDASTQEGFSPYILKAAFPPIPGEVLVRKFEEDDILISTGAACSSSKKKGKYRVLEQMGVEPGIAASSIRISIGRKTTGDDIIAFIRAAEKIIPDLKQALF